MAFITFFLKSVLYYVMINESMFERNFDSNLVRVNKKVHEIYRDERKICTFSY